MHNCIYAVVNENGISMVVIATAVDHARKLISDAGHQIKEIREIGMAYNTAAIGII